MIEAAAHIRPNPRVEHRTLTNGEGVLLHLDTAAYHGLNETGELIWDALGNGKSFAALIAAVRDRLEDAPEAVEDDIEAFVGSLRERDLIIVDRETPAS